MAEYGYGRLEHASARAKNELAYMRERWREQGSHEIIESVAAAAVGAGAGIVRGRYGIGALSVLKTAQKDAQGNEIKDAQGKTVTDPNTGVPIALLAAVAAHGLSYTSMAAGTRPEYRTAGDIFLTVGAMQIGERIGAKMKEKADQAAAGTGATTSTGMAGMAGGGYATREFDQGAHLTPEERQALWVARAAAGQR